jgi:hypothetical protein
LSHGLEGFASNKGNGVQKKVAPTKTLGATGTVIYAGIVYNKESNADLTGTKRYETFSEAMANVGIIAAGVRYFLNLVAKADWRVEPAEDSEEGERFANLFSEIMKGTDTPWTRIVRRAAMYRFYGFSVQEWTAKIGDKGIIGLADVAPRAQKTITKWDVDDSGKVVGIIQQDPKSFKEIYLPREKVVYLTDDSLDDSPEGLGLLRHVSEQYRVLKRYQQLEGWGLETDLRGVPIGRAPLASMQKMVDAGQITAAQALAAQNPLAEFIQGHVRNPDLAIILDSQPFESSDEKRSPGNIQQWGVELIKSGSIGQEAVAAAIVRKTREIAIVLGVEHFLLGENSRGSYALSRDKSDKLYLIVDATLTELGQAFTKDLVDPIWQLNGWPQELKPTLRTEAIRLQNVEGIASALRDAASAGVVLGPDDLAVAEFFELLGLTPPSIARADADAALIATGPAKPAEGDLPTRGGAEE